MSNRLPVLGAVLALLGLPPGVALLEAVSFEVHNRNDGSIVSSGEKREYLLYVPDSYDPVTPTPLVVTLHGGAIWPALQRDMSEWNRVAESEGFIVAYPAGLPVQGSGPRGWQVTPPGPGVEKDVRFIADLIDAIGNAHNIDPGRIYANGLSNGGGMAFALSCTLSDRFAAIGLVAAAQMLPWSWCEDARPMPMISFHGTADRIVPYRGGSTFVWSDSFPDVSDWTAEWARRNRCRPDAVEFRVAVDVTRRVYNDCADDAAVVLFTLDGGGHTWPGGMPMPKWFLGQTSDSVDATEQMWAFFAKQRLASERLR